MKKRKAFTLIELLVVIAIIVLLLAILLPSFNKARNNARAVVCQSRLKQWGTLLSMYIEENNNRLPNLITLLYHCGETKMSFCPMAVQSVEVAAGQPFKAWHVPEGYEGSYGYNQDLNYLMGFPTSPPDPNTNSYPIETEGGISIYTLKNSYNVPLLLDCSNYVGLMIATQGPPLTEYPIPNGPGVYTVANTFCINRHYGNVNSLFMDWSVRKVGLKELWKLKWNKDFETNGPWTEAGGVKPEDWPEWMRGFKDY